MRLSRVIPAIACLFGGLITCGEARAQDRPNILVIWGDDIGMWNVSAYHRGMMGGSTPNIDRIANEGILFTDRRRSSRPRP